MKALLLDRFCGISTTTKFRLINFSRCYTNHPQNALSFDAIPGPSRLSLLRSHLPGGKYSKIDFFEFHKNLRSQFGDIYYIPGIFGKRNTLVTYNPDDFEVVFRTEGQWPIRRVMDTFDYYRKERHKEIFQQAGGLNAEQGESWGKFRSIVNPVMVNPNTVKQYISKMNKVGNEFIKRINHIKDPDSNEVPDDFRREMSRWALESVVLVALDKELGLINDTGHNIHGNKLIEEISIIFKLTADLDLQPSLWKLIRTPKFNRMMSALDYITDIIKLYIDEAIEYNKFNKNTEGSVLQNLLKINSQVATVMAMDLMLAGVDTTVTALTANLLCLAKNPKNQDLLRKEILQLETFEMTEENMRSLPYLRACIKESIRLYPSASGNFRQTGKDVVLSGFNVPLGTDIYMPSKMSMRDDKYFARPNEFLPERWLRTNKDNSIKSTHPFVYLPFGFGPRSCTGKRIFDLELEILLAKIVRNFRVKFEHSDKDIFQTHFIIVPINNLKFKFISY